ncbi:LINE-1 reverse transcriptase like [Trifolium medium]|uniref:LINE-1 reverse transcriptase like n=1 Tax=Trifolium medium TaxID=97028 RepID=A0A392M9Y8_9FABA|nr:LINE-1 reverse transcriptase like [Trifolium medium]
MYKVLSKVLAGRLKKVMHSLISKVQTAFVQGRQILDGVLIANEVIDEAKRLNRETLLFKVDFEKAYDSVEWDFMDFVMKKMNFPLKWRHWIRECVSSSMVSILINGSPSKEFKMERGLRQGDPLSPFLFLLVAEGLNVLMDKAVADGSFVGYGVGRDESLSVSHLQFADDTLIIGRKSWTNIFAMKAILQLFELISGLKVNFHKSVLLGINVNDSWTKDAASALNCKVGELPIKYLGLPIGADPRRLKTWEPVIIALRKRLSSWSYRSLSMGGRLVLLKSVLSALPIYYLSFFKMPPGIISLIESLFKKFLWGGSEESRKIHWLKWDRVCKPKESGGLGLRDLKLFNLALLGKWGWRLKSETNSLWHSVLTQRYGESLDRIDNRSSVWWRDLNMALRFPRISGKGWFEENLRKVVGNGINTNFWSDPWVDGEKLRDQFNRLYDISLDKDKTVAKMLTEVDGERKILWSWRRNLFSWEEELVDVCNGVVLGAERLEGDSDNWKWGGACYSVKEAYSRLIEEDVEEVEWVKEVWNPLIPTKMSILGWRLFHNRLPTKDNLRKRGVHLNSSSLCVGGCGCDENAHHILFNCPMLSVVWTETLKWLGISTALSEGGFEHLKMFKGLVPGGKKVKNILQTIWFANIFVTWQARNAVVFSHEGFNGEKVVEEAKVWSWRILKNRSKGFNYPLYQWLGNPLACMQKICC